MDSEDDVTQVLSSKEVMIIEAYVPVIKKNTTTTTSKLMLDKNRINFL